MGAHGVDDDVLAIELVGPLSHNFEQGFRFDGDEDIAQKIVRGNAIGQVQEDAGEDLRQREANFARPRRSPLVGSRRGDPGKSSEKARSLYRPKLGWFRKAQFLDR